jgi:hypothetical protein
MIKFTIQADVDELMRLKAELPEAVRAASSLHGGPSSKSKAAEARVARIQKRLKEIEGE